MEPEYGRVVCSKAGRDKGKFMVIIEFDGVNCRLCDGKERSLDHPKLKRLKHISLTSTVLDSGSVATNRALRHALAPYNKGEKAIFKEETPCQSRT